MAEPEPAGQSRHSIVIYSAHPWHGLPYGLHHLARALAKAGWPVLFVEPPISPLHLLACRARGRRPSLRPRPSGTDRIWLYAPFALLTPQNLPILRGELVIGHWQALCVNSVQSAVRSTVFEDPVLALSGNPVFSPSDLAQGATIRAFRLADDDRLFQSIPDSLRLKARRELSQYDLVFATTQALKEQALRSGARRVADLPNGVDPALFRPRVNEPARLSAMPRPRIVYAGAFEDWFDWDAVRHAAVRLPMASFVMIGVSTQRPRRLPANIHLAGRVPHEELGAWLTHCDLGIIPFRHKRHGDAIAAIDPIKLWEYFACGLRVVASRDLNLAEAPGHLTFYREPKSLASTIAAVLAAAEPAAPPKQLAARDWSGIARNLIAECGLKP